MPTTKAHRAVANRAAKAKTAATKVKETSIHTQLSGFMDFVREQGVVGLAVGLAIGTSATVLVKSIVDSMVNPIIGALLPGSSNLTDKFVCIGSNGAECVNKFAWGAVVSNLISFFSFLCY